MNILFRLIVLTTSFVVFMGFSFIIVATIHTMSTSATLFLGSYIIMWISYLYGTLDLIGEKVNAMREKKDEV